MKYFFINNSKINYVPNNRSIIEYCENLGIDIPHYCYHPKLSIAGNCRMCLVEVKGSPKPVISCAIVLYVIKVVNVTYKINRLFSV